MESLRSVRHTTRRSHANLLRLIGPGVERMAMLRHGVNDIKFYYEGDVRFLSQLARSA